MLQFGPFIMSKEIKAIEPKIEELLTNLSRDFIGTTCFPDQNLCVKVFGEDKSYEYGNERECILELQSTESVPLLVAYNDEDLWFVWDYVHGQKLLTYSKEQGIPIREFEEELIESLQSMLKKGWYLPNLTLEDIIWCIECGALFIVNYSGCERIHEMKYEEYHQKVTAQIATLLNSAG